VPPPESQPDRQHIPVIFVTAMCSWRMKNWAGNRRGGLHHQAHQPAGGQGWRAHLALYDQTRELERMVAQRTRELLTRASKSSSAWGVPPNSRTTKPAITSSAWPCLAPDCRSGWLGDKAQEILQLAAPMHDIGKIGIRTTSCSSRANWMQRVEADEAAPANGG
jgi:putative two-component system response regulator